MDGIVILPIAAVSAAADPEIPAKNMEPTTVIKPNPPLIWPTNVYAKSISFSDIPPRSMIDPASIKNGIAINVNESVPVNILWGITTNGIWFNNNNVMVEAIPSANAIGTCIVNRMSSKIIIISEIN